LGGGSFLRWPGAGEKAKNPCFAHALFGASLWIPSVFRIFLIGIMLWQETVNTYRTIRTYITIRNGVI
jgi:hypothetical protein